MVLVPALLILCFSTQQTDAYSLPKFLIAAVAAAYCSWQRLPGSKLDMPIIAFLLATGLSAALGANPVRGVFGLYMSYSTALLPNICLAALFYGSIGLRRDYVVGWTLVGALLACACGFAQLLGLAWATPYPLLSDVRIYSTTGSPLTFSGILAMLAPWLIAHGAWQAMPAFAVCVIATMSRGGLLAFSLSVAWMFRRRFSVKWLAALALFAGLGGWVVLSNRTHTAQSDAGRVVMARAAWGAFRSSPMTGNGPETLGAYLAKTRTAAMDAALGPTWHNSYAHNLFLEALGAQGILGFAALLWIIISVFHVIKGDAPLMAMGLALFSFSMFQPTPLFMKAIFAMFLGASQRPRGELWRPLEAALRLGSLAALVFAVLMVASCRLYQTGSQRLNYDVLMESSRVLPRFYR